MFPGKKHLAGELWGGFAAMLVALPSSIAYGISIYSVMGSQYVGYGVRAGILGAIAMGLIAPLLGGAPRLISAPCAPAAAVLAALAVDLLQRTSPDAFPPDRILVMLVIVALLSGALQFLYGMIRGGRLIKYIPYPVVSGYLSGVGLLIFFSQIPNFLGLSEHGKVAQAVIVPRLWHWPAIVVGSVTILTVLLTPKLTKAIPATIIGLFAGILTYFAIAILFVPELLLLDHNKLIIGSLQGADSSMGAMFTERWTSLHALQVSDLAVLVIPALTLSVLLSIDTLKTCVVVDAITRSRHNSNRELLGQGAANIASALIGGMPGSGTMGPTLVNVNSGGRKKLSGVMEGVFVLAAYLVFSRWIAWIPIAALAGILIVVAFRMFDWKTFQLLRQASTLLDFGVIAAVIIVAVKFSLIAASATGLALAVFLFIREQIRGSVIHRKMNGSQLTSKQHRLSAERKILEQKGVETIICELQGTLFFGTTDQLITEMESDLKSCRYLILDMRRVVSVDFTAVHMFEQFEATLKERKGFLIFSRLPGLPTGQDLKKYFKEVGLTARQQNVRRFDSLDDALQWVEDLILAEAGLRTPSDEKPLQLSEIELFRECDAEMLAALSSSVAERSCAAGEIIFKSGDEGDELFLIRRGIVRIVLRLEEDNYHNLASFGSGDFFGEMAFLDRGLRSADAVATKPTDLFVVSRSKLDEISRAYPLVGEKVFVRLARALAIRLRDTDNELGNLYEL